MVEVTPARLVDGIQNEEVRFRAPMSENTRTRMAASVNFINERQYDTYKWDANGRFSLFTILTSIDGRFGFLFDVEIIGYSLIIGTSGTSGTSTFDIHKFTGGDTDAGTIFSTKPAITSAAANGSQSIIRLDPASDLQLPAGHTRGVFTGEPTLPSFLAGEALEAQIDAAAAEARNASLAIQYRPI